MKRRALLVAASLSLSAAVAGCLGGSDDDNGDDTGESGDNGENGDENGENGTGENGENGDGNGENGTRDEFVDEAGNVPADLLAEYYGAVLRADIDAANDLLHSEMSGEAREVHFGSDSGLELVALDVDIVDEDVDGQEFNVEPLPEGEPNILAAAVATYEESDGTEGTAEGEFVLVSEDGQWKLWDLVGGWFRYAPAYLEITGLTGVVGDEDAIHELRIGVQSTSESDTSDLTSVRLTYIPAQGSAEKDPGVPTTVQIADEVTTDTNPEEVEPEVVEVDGRPADRFGVSVVSADDPENLFLDPGDEYELVIDTSGEEHGDLPGLPPLRSGHELMLQMDTIFAMLDTYETEIPDLEGLDVGDEVDI